MEHERCTRHNAGQIWPSEGPLLRWRAARRVRSRHPPAGLAMPAVLPPPARAAPTPCQPCRRCWPTLVLAEAVSRRRRFAGWRRLHVQRAVLAWIQEFVPRSGEFAGASRPSQSPGRGRRFSWPTVSGVQIGHWAAHGHQDALVQDLLHCHTSSLTCWATRVPPTTTLWPWGAPSWPTPGRRAIEVGHCCH